MPYEDKDKKSEYMREYYKKNREKRLAAMRARYAEKRDEIRAKERAKFKADPDKWRPFFIAQKKAWNEKHPGYHNDLQRRVRAHYRKLLLDAFGNACACCGETIPEFLTLDHILGDGKYERTRFSGHLYAKVAKDGFPKDRYRLLCFNCNWACREGRICPHQQRRDGLPIPDC